eukprot:Phypoly_transcript_12136.p1 GENE.Phypoly_transcript_12136~~Phypoly_transcript_12136.p1  ORF type:complete len:372 (+),score=55.98 Phypoly_transcript_12136:81-1118(+)
MNKLIVLICLIGCAFSATPAAPQIPNVFYAKISVTMGEGRNYWRGGGVEAYDVPNGKARIDINLEGNTGSRQIHYLERYDLNETFSITETKCIKQKSIGTLETPFEWVGKATYEGTSSFQGVPLDVWTYTQSGGTTMKVSVLQSNPNVPVLYTEKNINGSAVVTTDITYVEFNPKIPGDWLFYIPQICDSHEQLLRGDASSAVYFANTHWDCADISCSSRVPAGSSQPNYACAEFVARSVAYGGFFPGLSASDPQSTYLNWKGYDLCYTTHLADALVNLAGYRKVAASGSAVVAAGAIFGNAGDGSWSHTCVGIAAGTVDCHNNAREDLPASSIMYEGVDEVLAP